MALPSYYHSNPNLNVSINGIPIGEGSPRAYMNDALRQMMGDIFDWTAAYGLTSPVSIGNGGTGQTTDVAGFTALAAHGGTMGDNLVFVGRGVFPHFASSAMIGGQIFFQAMGADPMAQRGDIVFEW